jgi:hypothetical protein
MREMIPKLSGETYYSRKTDQNIQHEVLENGLKVPEEGPNNPSARGAISTLVS